MNPSVRIVVSMLCLLVYTAQARTDSAPDRVVPYKTFEEGKALIDDLAQFGVPVLLLSGG